MDDREKVRIEAKRKVDKLFDALYEAENEGKTAFQENKEKLQSLKNDLQEKYDRLENFGGETMEELTKAFEGSAQAFEESINNIKEKKKSV